MEPFIEINHYETQDGHIPFQEWFQGLDSWTARRIDTFLDRLERGNWGHSFPVGHGVSELKIDFGPGYRIYYLNEGTTVVILLCGGDKGSQEKDIRKAHLFAADHRRRK